MNIRRQISIFVSALVEISYANKVSTAKQVNSDTTKLQICNKADLTLAAAPDFTEFIVIVHVNIN